MTTSLQKKILERIQTLKRWKRGEVRAPHKPLLVLLSLARLTQGKERLESFENLEGPLQRLLEQFGPYRRRVHPEYPFWRLQNDRLWEVPNGSSLARRKSNTDPPKSELIKHN